MAESEMEILRLSALSVIISSQLIASTLKRRALKVKFQDENCPQVFRKIYDRPVYKQSTWWTMLAKGDCKILGHPQNKLFRRRFSVPFSMFKDIVEESRLWVLDNGKLMGETGSDCIGVEGVPLELKILGALRMSAKGCSFDAIAELSGMSISTMHTFYHFYWAKFVTVFKERWIYYPTTAAEAADNLKVYSRLGFPGAIGSIDCTHVMWGRCPALYQNTYTGKEKKATVAYEVLRNKQYTLLPSHTYLNAIIKFEP